MDRRKSVLDPVGSGETVNMTVRLPRELMEAFDRACAAKDLTRSQVMRMAIRSWLDGEKQMKLKL